MGQYFYNNNNSNNDNNDNVNTILVTILSATKHTDTFFFSETGIITGLKIFYSDLSDVIWSIVNVGFMDARFCTRERFRIADEDKIRA